MVLQLGMMGPLGAGMGIVMSVVGIVISALFLWLSAAKIFKTKDKTWMTPLVISVIAGVVGFVLGLVPVLNMLSWLVVIVLTMYLIKSKYRVDWMKSFLIWLVAAVLSFVAFFIIGTLFFGGLMMGYGMMGGFG
jgi:hypothetical protein